MGLTRISKRSSRLPARAADQHSAASGQRDTERRGIQSADKAAEVLMALVSAGQAAPLRELARAVDMPASLVHRYLASLITTGLAAQNHITALYDLGPNAIRIAAAPLARVDPTPLASEAMRALVAATCVPGLPNVYVD